MRGPAVVVIVLVAIFFESAIASPCKTCQTALGKRDIENIVKRQLNVHVDESRPVIHDDGSSKNRRHAKSEKENQSLSPSLPEPYTKLPVERKQKRNLDDESELEKSVDKADVVSQAAKESTNRPPEPPTNKLLHPHR